MNDSCSTDVGSQSLRQDLFAENENSEDEMESLMVLDTEDLVEDPSQENDEKVDDFGATKKKRASRILDDSDSEVDIPKGVEDELGNSKEDDKTPVPGIKKRFSNLIDTDSEPENNDTSEKEMSVHENISSKIRKKKILKKSDRAKKDKGKKKSRSSGDDILAGLNLDLGSDSSSSGSERSNNSSGDSDANLSGDEQVIQSSSNIEEGRKQRLSAKEAIEQMKTIQSESQRMAREAKIDFPYHKPKQHSLKEFLNRKNVNKTIVRPQIGSHRSIASTIKMTTEELEAYAKHLDEREKEAEEFFKSESEEEEEEEAEAQDLEQISNSKQSNVTIAEQTNVEAAPLSSKTTDELLQEMDQAIDSIGNSQNEAIPKEINDQNIESNEIVLVENITSAIPSIETLDVVIVSNVDKGTTDINSLSPKASEEDSSKIQPLTSKLNKRLMLENLPTIKDFTYDQDTLIDLETGDVFKKPPTEVDLLKEKYLKYACKKNVNRKHDSENKNQTEENYENSRSNEVLRGGVKDAKPGAAYFKLQEALQQKITETRLKEVLKRDLYNKKLEEEREQYSGDEIDSENDDANEENEQEEEDGLDPVVTENDVLENDVEDTEMLDQNLSEDDADDDDTSSSDDDDEELETESTKPRKNRIIKAFVDSDDDDDDVNNENRSEEISCNTEVQVVNQSINDEINLLETSAEIHDMFKVPDLLKAPEKNNMLDLNCEANTENMNSMKLLWDSDSEKPSDDCDLLEFCSGKFGPTQPTVNRPTNINDLCDNGMTQNLNDDEILNLCSGKFVTQINSEPKINDLTENNQELNGVITNKRHAILSSDEEDVVENTDIQKVKKLKKKKRNRPVLNISDDESSESEEQDDEEILVEEVDEPETYIDYDSEENEVEVKLTKKDTRAAAASYFENEAELSGSEYNSADEDEKDLDRFERELGDEEQFDQDQLQSELGKIHMRRMLDQDTREVKLLQEMFFEDEEKDGVGRTRKFMWSNLNTELNMHEMPQDGAEDDLRESDEENEEQFRKMRYEREMLLTKKNEEKENLMELNGTQMELTGNLNKSGDVTDTPVTKKRITIVKKQVQTDTNLQQKNILNSPFLITFSNEFQKSNASFLGRDAEILNKIADVVKEKDGDTVGSVLGKAKNFVFTTVAPPSGKQSVKRSSDANHDSENQIKRQKIVAKPTPDKSKKRMLDGLAQ